MRHRHKYRRVCDRIGSHPPAIKLICADDAVAGGGFYVDMLPELFEYFGGFGVDGYAGVACLDLGEISVLPLPFLRRGGGVGENADGAKDAGHDFGAVMVKAGGFPNLGACGEGGGCAYQE